MEQSTLMRDCAWLTSLARAGLLVTKRLSSGLSEKCAGKTLGYQA
jgi:hypothetical protein